MLDGRPATAAAAAAPRKCIGKYATLGDERRDVSLVPLTAGEGEEKGLRGEAPRKEKKAFQPRHFFGHPNPVCEKKKEGEKSLEVAVWD